MSKQDRQGVRTFEQLMRRFNLDGIDENVVTEMFKQISQVNEHLTSLSTTVTQKLNILLSSNQTWFYGGVPTMESYPAAEWTDTTQKDSHIGDFYYDTDNENVYIFTKCDGIYEWKSCFSGGCDVDRDAIRQEGYDEGYNDGYSKGYTDGQEEWSNPLEYATNSRYIYQDAVFPTDYELSVNIPLVTNLISMFYQSKGIKKVVFQGNINNTALNLGMTFNSAEDVEIIDFTNFKAKIGNGRQTFNRMNKLQEILGELDFSECTDTTNMFASSPNLATITPKKESIKISMSFSQSSKLSAQSIQSIFDGLATVTTAQTLTLNANQNVLQSQIDSANAKGWTVVGGKVVEEAW